MAALQPAVRPLDPSLDALRREIDSIDDTMRDLLARRAEIALAVAKAKARQGGSGAPLFRPGREAEIMRRLIGHSRPPLSAALVYRVWRDIIVASTCLQGPFSVAVAAKRQDLAREHFGDRVLRPVGSVAAVLSAVAKGRGTVGVVPMPGRPADGRWWLSLAKGLTIVGGLPFLTTSERRKPGECAVIIGRRNFEPSGDDIFFLRVESERREVAPLGLRSSTVLASVRRGRRWLQLVETAMSFEEAAKLGTGRTVRLLGGYARPIVLPSASLT
ncbi:MAG TPA: chorismate mutase [Alphaproteobacteria bacterium]